MNTKKSEFRTIVKKQNWAYFISQLENNTNLKWSFISKLTNYNPFNEYNSYVGVEVSSDGCIWIFDNIDKSIDILSNEDFIKKSILYYAKDKCDGIIPINGIACYVKRNEFNLFKELLYNMRLKIKWDFNIFDELFLFETLTSNIIIIAQIHLWNNKNQICLRYVNVNKFDDKALFLSQEDFLNIIKEYKNKEIIMLEHEASVLMNTFLSSKDIDMDNSIAFNMELIAEKNIDETEESWNVYILDKMTFKVYEYYFWNEDLSAWEEVDIIERVKQKSPVKEHILQWREETL